MKPLKENSTIWAALDAEDNSTVLAQSTNPLEVAEIAKKSGKNFIMSFIPKEGQTYIF